MWYLVITVFYVALGGEVNIYADDFRAKQYCEEARVKFIEYHGMEKVKDTNVEIRNIECVRVEGV